MMSGRGRLPGVHPGGGVFVPLDRGGRAIIRYVESLLVVAYGVLYDWIFRRFRPYRALLQEILEYAGRSLEGTRGPAPLRVLELGCGTGNFSAALAGRGYEVVGEDPYLALVERARRKEARGHRVSFRVGAGADGGYDLAVSVHALYAQPDPARELERAFGRLRPGGHAIVVNFARRAPVVATARAVWAREGMGAALHALWWLVPNAVFDMMRGRRESHYWTETELRTCLEGVGFEVLQIRPTFLNGISLLAWCRKGP